MMMTRKDSNTISTPASPLAFPHFSDEETQAGGHLRSHGQNVWAGKEHSVLNSAMGLGEGCT